MRFLIAGIDKNEKKCFSLDRKIVSISSNRSNSVSAFANIFRKTTFFYTLTRTRTLVEKFFEPTK